RRLQSSARAFAPLRPSTSLIPWSCPSAVARSLILSLRRGRSLISPSAGLLVLPFRLAKLAVDK
ncbi:hypothetical protein S83_031479, partial [Arachis hypogaea]